MAETIELERETVELLIEGSSHLYECAFLEERAKLIRDAVERAETKLDD